MIIKKTNPIHKNKKQRKTININYTLIYTTTHSLTSTTHTPPPKNKQKPIKQNKKTLLKYDLLTPSSIIPLQVVGNTGLDIVLVLGVRYYVEPQSPEDVAISGFLLLLGWCAGKWDRFLWVHQGWGVSAGIRYSD